MKRKLGLRRATFYLLVGFLLLADGLDLISHLFFTDIELPHRIHTVGHAAISAAVLAAMLSQLVAPRRFLAAVQLVIVLGLVGTIAELVTHRFGGFPEIFLALGIAIGLLHPLRRQIFRPQIALDRLLLTVACAGAIPLLWFSWDEAATQRHHLDPYHSNVGHHELMATLAALAVAWAALAALRTPGWQLPAWAAGLTVASYGAASLAYQGYSSAATTGWATTALISGIGFIGLAHRPKNATHHTVANPPAPATRA